MTDWIEHIDPPRDYADTAWSDDTETSMRLIALIGFAVLHLMLGLGTGWLLWG